MQSEQCSGTCEVILNFLLLDKFLGFIQERETIRNLREAGAPKPWTVDATLRDFRFCNVRREDDVVTKWLFTNVYPHNSDPITALVCRLFNWPATLDDFTWPYNRASVQYALKHRKQDKMFGAAYIVSTNGVKQDKASYVLDVVDVAMNKGFNFIGCATLYGSHTEMTRHRGVGNFMAGQIIADLKHFNPWYMGTADHWTFCTPGPGSKRGLNRLMGLPVKAPLKTPLFVGCVHDLQPIIIRELGLYLDAQNVQNCLCEFDKYMRHKTGEGRPKCRYNGGKQP